VQKRQKEERKVGSVLAHFFVWSPEVLSSFRAKSVVLTLKGSMKKGLFESSGLCIDLLDWL
jgi:hypothetical protein